MFKKNYHRGMLVDTGNVVGIGAGDDIRRQIDEIVDAKEAREAEEREHRKLVEKGTNSQIILLTKQLDEAKTQNAELVKINENLKTTVEKQGEQIKEMKNSSKQTKTWAIVSTAIAIGSFLVAIVGIVLAVVL